MRLITWAQALQDSRMVYMYMYMFPRWKYMRKLHCSLSRMLALKPQKLATSLFVYTYSKLHCDIRAFLMATFLSAQAFQFYLLEITCTGSYMRHREIYRGQARKWRQKIITNFFYPPCLLIALLFSFYQAQNSQQNEIKFKKNEIPPVGECNLNILQKFLK